MNCARKTLYSSVFSFYNTVSFEQKALQDTLWVFFLSFKVLFLFSLICLAGFGFQTALKCGTYDLCRNIFNSESCFWGALSVQRSAFTTPQHFLFQGPALQGAVACQGFIFLLFSENALESEGNYNHYNNLLS